MAIRSITKANQEAAARLNEWVKPGDTIYTVLRHVSDSKMMRRISLIVFRERVYTLDTNVSLLGIGSMLRGQDGIRITGYGEDKGFVLVYELGRALYPNGFTCPGKNCHSNDHMNGDQNYKPHTHTDGGYAFRQEWI